MKTIGLAGGTGWISSAEYYRIINLEFNRRMGGLESARCILYSMNYGEIDRFNQQNDREGVFRLVLNATRKLDRSGADCIVLCANTLHQFIGRLEKETRLPFINIAEATGDEARRMNLKSVGLLGTRQTMEMDFYKEGLKKKGVDVVIPDPQERDLIQKTISEELLKGSILEDSRKRFTEICRRLNERGAEGIILGCTEIPLLIRQADINIPLIDTLAVHALAAVDFALGE